MDRYESKIQELISEIERDAIDEFMPRLEDTEHCEVCGVPRHELTTIVGEAKVRTHYVECPACDSDVWLDEVVVRVEGENIPTTRKHHNPQECPTCGKYKAKDLVLRGELHSEDVSQRLIQWINIHQFAGHHTSYSENETIRVCYPCHTKIHKTDGYRDDLKPEMSREQAYELGHVNTPKTKVDE
jgi:hypothetical protein